MEPFYKNWKDLEKFSTENVCSQLWRYIFLIFIFIFICWNFIYILANPLYIDSDLFV